MIRELTDLPVDLTPTVEGTGPARLLDVKAGRSAKVLTDWLGDRTQTFPDSVEVFSPTATATGWTGYGTLTMIMPPCRWLTWSIKISSTPISTQTGAPDANSWRALIDKLRRGLPSGLEEIAQLGRTLWRKREQILAFFDKEGASDGPVDAINGRLEHL